LFLCETKCIIIKRRFIAASAAAARKQQEEVKLFMTLIDQN